MKRRRWIYGSAGLAAGALGALSAWWLHLPGKIQPAGAHSHPFWAVSLQTPGGQSLAMASLRGRPLLVNFWATWCPPCIEELPLLDAFHQAHRNRGWQMLGIAIDQPSAVRGWMQRSPLSFPVALGGLEGSQMSQALGNTSGGLPFSVLFAGSGDILERKLGQLSADDLERWAARL
ncbi:MAG: TlpA family protein disulfide reductase [Betaproteobacteria bacterium]|nr:TlpA family protein disulfide reductase [Betaproteobacteria bacterium]